MPGKEVSEDMAKMTVDHSICKGCGLCVTVCPKKIILLDKSVLNIKGYHPAVVSDMESYLPRLRNYRGEIVKGSEIYWLPVRKY